MKLKDKMRNHKNIFSILVMVTLLVFSSEISAQEKEDKTLQKEQKQLLRESRQLNSEASVALAEDKFVEGEADYRKAIAINPKSETAKYNLGNAYYNKAKNDEAMSRFQQAADVATSKKLLLQIINSFILDCQPFILPFKPLPKNEYLFKSGSLILCFEFVKIHKASLDPISISIFN